MLKDPFSSGMNYEVEARTLYYNGVTDIFLAPDVNSKHLNFIHKVIQNLYYLLYLVMFLEKRTLENILQVVLLE